MTNPTTNKPDAMYSVLKELYDARTMVDEGDQQEQAIAQARAAIYKEIERVCLEVIGEEWPKPWNNNQIYLATNDYAIKTRQALRAEQRFRLTKALEDMKGEQK